MWTNNINVEYIFFYQFLPRKTKTNNKTTVATSKWSITVLSCSSLPPSSSSPTASDWCIVIFVSQDNSGGCQAARGSWVLGAGTAKIGSSQVGAFRNVLWWSVQYQYHLYHLYHTTITEKYKYHGGKVITQVCLHLSMMILSFSSLETRCLWVC